MNGKRIVIFGWSSSVHVIRWVEGLIGRGYHVKVISLGGDEISNVETVNFPRKGKLSYFSYAGKAKEEALKFKPDLVHVHYAGGFGWWGVKTNFSPMVVSVWGSDIEKLAGNPLAKYFVKKSLERADIITATGTYLKEKTVSFLPSVADKIEVVPFGVNLPPELPEFPVDSPFKICYIKGHRMVYGPDILLKAMVEVKKNIPGIQLDMAGSGEETDTLKNMIRDLDLADNVNLVGFIETEKMYDFIGGHHLMVMPSRREGFGVAVLEVSACGRPVIASDVGGIPEVLIDGKTGILVPPCSVKQLAKAIKDMAEDKNKRQTMGRAGYEFVRGNYSRDITVDKMCKIYERLSGGEN